MPFVYEVGELVGEIALRQRSRAQLVSLSISSSVHSFLTWTLIVTIVTIGSFDIVAELAGNDFRPNADGFVRSAGAGGG